MSRLLVTGGAGYIGSHAVRALRREGHQVVVVDNFSTGHADTIPGDVEVLPFCISNPGLGPKIRKQKIDAVFHFAGLSDVSRSVAHPDRYYQENLVATLELLNHLEHFGPVIFSSSAAVYGYPVNLEPIDEDHPTDPISPYGETKLAVERAMIHYARAYGLRFAALRYFNAAGAGRSSLLSERHHPETHLIPNLLAAAETGKPFTIHGTDYDTRDGTAVRDFVHVDDLVDGHLAAWRHLEIGRPCGMWNLGSGQGTSVQETIDVARSVTGRRIDVIRGPRRDGDPPSLVADIRRARRDLQWYPARSNLARMIGDAWEARKAAR